MATRRARPVIGRRSLAGLMLLLAVGGSAACGAGDGGNGAVGELVPNSFTSPASPVASKSKAPPGAVIRATPTASVRTSGGGTFVLSMGAVAASVKLPGDRDQKNVAAVRAFLRRAGAPGLRIASVTMANHSSSAFTLSGLEVQTASGVVPLYPVATFVNLALALPGAGAKPDLASDASVILLTSPAKIAAGQTVTTLVGTTASLGKITGLVYRQGDSTTRLRPLWEVQQNKP